MAREDIFDADSTEAVAQVEVAEGTGPEVVTEDTTEAPAQTDAEKAEAEAKAAEEALEHEITVAAFTEAVDAVVETADPETGTVPEADLDRLSNLYREVTGGNKYKKQAKDHLAAGMTAALTSGPDGYSRAAAYNEVQEAILSVTSKSGGTKPKATPVDPAKVSGERIAVYRTALSLVESQAVDGFEEHLPDEAALGTEAQRLLDWTVSEADDKGDAPEVSPLAAAAVKLALGKAVGKAKAGAGTSASTYTGPRRDVGAHIANAFSTVDSGTFLSVAQIRAIDSEEYGPNDRPSAGAISARLFPKSGKVTIEGIIPGENDKGVNGATKA